MLQPQERFITVMFSDIRSFTSLAERSAPADVFAFLNSYFSAMVEVINAHDGTIDKFGGDSIMAVWGAPLDDPEHAAKAVRCAVAMRAALAEFNLARVKEGGEPIAIGIGLHTGPVISGTLGTKERAEYTVIGDTVNTAARLEGLTKDMQTDIVASDATVQHSGGVANFVPAGDFSVKGRTKTIAVYRVGAVVDQAA
jgi:adenylate cyclase